MKQGQVSQEQIIGILQQAERGEQTISRLVPGLRHHRDDLLPVAQEILRA